MVQAACSSGSTDPDVPSAGAQATGNATGNPPNMTVGGGAGSQSGSMAASNAGGAAPSGQQPAGGAGSTSGTSGMSAPMSNSAGSGSDPAMAGAGNDMAGSGTDPGPAGAAVTMPNIGSVGLGNGGIGVNDLDKATEFFTTLVGMKVQTEMIEREDRFERVLTLGELADKPSVTLMKYKDGRVIKDIPSKLVFYAQSPSETVTKIAAGGYSVVLNIGAIAQVTAIDGYLLEFLQDATGPMFISIAFAVTDLDKTNQLYTTAFNLKSTGDYNDITMMGLTEHFIQAMDGGAALVLQHYSLGEHNYLNNPCKSVWHVKDAAAQLDKVVMLGGTMVSPAAPLPAFDNHITSIAKDFDGYVIEMVQD